MLQRRGFRDAAVGGRVGRLGGRVPARKGFSADLGARPLRRASSGTCWRRSRRRSSSGSSRKGDQFLFVTARDETDSRSPSKTRTRAKWEPEAAEAAGRPERPHPRARRTRAGGDRGRRPPSSGATLASLRRAGLLLGRAEAGCAGRGARAGLLAIGGTAPGARPDRVPRPSGRPATATAERLAARLVVRGAMPTCASSSQLLATRLHVSAAALAGLDVREASDATVTVRAGKAEDTAGLRQVRGGARGDVRRLGRRPRHAGPGGTAMTRGAVVLEVAGLGAYTLLKPEIGFHVLELPHEGQSLFRPGSPCSSTSSRSASAGTGRSRRIGATLARSCGGTGITRHPSFATRPGCARAGSTACWAGDFDLLADAPPD